MNKNIIFLIAFLFSSITTIFAQIPNAGFENWTGNNPNGWDNLNSLTSIMNIYTCSKGTPGNPGNAYMKLESKSVPLIGIVPGVALCGTIDKTNFTPKSGFPYTQRPIALSGSWQYQASGADMGYVVIAFTKWNTVSQKRDTISTNGFNLPGSFTSWTNFNLPISFTSAANPDTCLIALSASGQTPVAGSYLWVDNLNFEFTIDVKDTKKEMGIKIFPNPAKDKLHLEIPALKDYKTVQCKILNYTGQIVHQFHISSEKDIDISDLPSGFYQLLVIADKNQFSAKFIKE